MPRPSTTRIWASRQSPSCWLTIEMTRMTRNRRSIPATISSRIGPPRPTNRASRMPLQLQRPTRTRSMPNRIRSRTIGRRSNPLRSPTTKPIRTSILGVKSPRNGPRRPGRCSQDIGPGASSAIATRSISANGPASGSPVPGREIESRHRPPPTSGTPQFVQSAEFVTPDAGIARALRRCVKVAARRTPAEPRDPNRRRGPGIHPSGCRPANRSESTQTPAGHSFRRGSCSFRTPKLAVEASRRCHGI